MKRSTVITLIILFLLLPATVYFGSRLPGQSYYLTGTLVVIETLIPFFCAFETRKPQARELVLLAVLCALAVASRAVFAWAPHFKPVMAIVMLSGMALGPQAGFLVGAVTAFSSNFLFGQGPWTPWQMLAFGVGGFLAGLFRRRKWITDHPVVLAFFGFFCTVLVVGPLLDICAVFTMQSAVTWQGSLLVLAAGIPANLVHGLCVAVTMLILGRPMLEKLTRIRIKYGMAPEENAL